MIRLARTCFLIFAALWGSACSSPSAQLAASDLDALTGAPWVGTLTYRDYATSKPITIPSSLIVRRITTTPADPPAWEFGYGYSKEPHADSTSTLTLRDNGRTLGDESVIARGQSVTGVLSYITECHGEDDNRPATFRFEHSLSPTYYARRKLVRFDGERDFFERHWYRWSREGQLPAAQ